MISKNTIKLVKSLNKKKYRDKHKLFIAEGDKTVQEVLDSSFEVVELIATESFLIQHDKTALRAKKISETTPEQIKKASLLKAPQNCLAVCKLPDSEKLPQQLNNHTLFLDGIQDPGNLGTIIRTCDWFGMNPLLCSSDTADIFNPKVIQASMGSICRVSVYYSRFDAAARLAGRSGMPIYGAYTKGQNIYKSPLPAKALIVLGNEGNGIRQQLDHYIQNKISIPVFQDKKNKPESLNVAVTAAIICSEFNRIKFT